MKREIVVSLILHFVVVSMFLVASPFRAVSRLPDGEVIRVQLIAGAELMTPATAQVSQAPAPAISKPPPEKPTEVPVREPTTAKKPIPDKPKAKRETPAVEPEKTPKATEGVGGDQSGTEIHVPPTAGGSPIAGATIDNASFSYPYWFTQAFNKILRNWRNPVSSDGVIICVVYFQVIKSGRVVEARIATSSGIPPFDEACLRAVESSSPFPPLPREFTDEIIGLTLPFKYEPR